MFEPSQVKELSAPLDRQHVRQRAQAGRQLSYIEGWHAIAEANRIFGFSEWDRELKDIRQLGEPREVDGKWRVAYMATVRVKVRAGGVEDVVTRDGTGYGSGVDRDIGQAHESAIKEAETDAMKRALMTFGNPFGLALYDKEQRDVADAKPPEPQRADDETIRTYCTEFNAQLKRCSSRMDVEKAWSNGLAKRKAFGIEVGDDDYQRLAGFCKDRIEEIALPEDAP